MSAKRSKARGRKSASNDGVKSSRLTYIDVTRRDGGVKGHGKSARFIQSSAEARREALERYLRLPECQYDYLGELIDVARPGLAKIYRFAKAVANGQQRFDEELLLDLALSLAQFLKAGNLKTQQAAFAKQLGIVRLQGRKAPPQGEPIDHVRAAKAVMDLRNAGQTRTDAIRQVCKKLLHRDADVTMYRTVERWYDTHHNWVTFVYSIRDELRAQAGRNEFLTRIENYIARLEKN